MKLKIGDKIIPKKGRWVCYGYDPKYMKYFEISGHSDDMYWAKPVFKSDEKKQEYLEDISIRIGKWINTIAPQFVVIKVMYKIGEFLFFEEDIEDFELVKED